MQEYRIAILGTVGVPGNYGGFETLAENLVQYHNNTGRKSSLTVYCSCKAFKQQLISYGSARLRYIGLDANGVQSIPYDVISLLHAALLGHNRLLLLGVSGALSLPILKLVSRARILTNIDGIEWQRDKWKGFAKAVLRLSEWAAVRFSHTIIADNLAIADYLTKTYATHCKVICYGGDHALEADPDPVAVVDLPKGYALALCRIEPENNVQIILEAFDQLEMPLVFIGNWDKSHYGRDLKARYRNHPNIIIHDPVYEPHSLRAIRDLAIFYVHGHSAGGTNPSLVEMMHFGIPVFAYDCSFNRQTTENKALFFSSADELAYLVCSLTEQDANLIGRDMLEIARRCYTWSRIGKTYFDLLEAD